MKMIKKFKKAFTMIELSIVIAAVAVLTGASVGIYFGVTSGNPEEVAVSTQDTVLNLWKDFIGDSSKYNADIETKAKEFCLTHASSKGINAELNYRVMQYDDFVSTIIPHEDGPQNEFRAYDPSGNQKEAAIILIGTEYPSYFISTSYSVLKVSEPQADEKLLVNEIVNDVYVSESKLLEKYNLNADSSIEDFELFFELSNINVNGEIKRGIKYVRYLVNDVKDRDGGEFKPRFCVFGRANRSLNDDCESTYLPGSFEFNYNGSMFIVDDYDLIEVKDNKDYYYDPNYLYSKYSEMDTYISGYNSKVTYDFVNKKMNNESSPLSVSKNQYVVAEQQISYEAYLNLGGDKGGMDSGSSNPNFGEINIFVPKDKLPDRPVVDGDTDMDDVIKNYPICLYFAEEVEIVVEDMPTITKILQWLGITKTVFQYLYFNNFDVVNTFINADNFYELLVNSTDKNVYLYISEGAALDTVLTIPEHFNFVVHHRPEIEVKNGVENDIRIKNLEQFKSYSKDVTMMEKKHYSSKENTPYQVTWPEKPVKSFKITKNGLLDFKTGSRLFVESNCYASSSNAWGSSDNHKPTPWGYTISEYGEIVNEGVIRLRGNAEARITGIVRSETGSGRIIATDNSIISEPFRITDYTSNYVNETMYIGRNIFPSDFYYLDSIRCKLELSENVRYIGLLALNDVRRDGAVKWPLTYLGAIDLVSQKNYDPEGSRNNYGSIFKLAGVGTTLVKSYDVSTKRAIFNLTSGKLVYGYAWVDVLSCYWNNPAGSSYNKELGPAFPKFSTKNSGFKLSNIDLIIDSGCTFNIPGEPFNKSNTGYPELEILPNSSITVKEGGQMVIGPNSYIYISNYFGSTSYFDKYTSEINRTDIWGSTANKNIRSVLIDAFNKLKYIYENSQKPMFNVQGTILVDRTVSVLSETETNQQYIKCTKAHDHNYFGWIHYECDTDLKVSAHLNRSVIESAIYNWGFDKIFIKNINYNNINNQYDYAIGYIYQEHMHYNGWDICKNFNTVDLVPVYFTGTNRNDVAYAYYGDTDSYDYPPYILTF